MRQLCHYESLIDGTLDLSDIAMLNEYLDIHDENNRRLSDHMRHELDG